MIVLTISDRDDGVVERCVNVCDTFSNIFLNFLRARAAAALFCAFAIGSFESSDLQPSWIIFQ